MTVNGVRLVHIDAYSARKIFHDGAILIAEQDWRDKDYKVTRSAFYRCRVMHKKTVAGIDVAIVSDPNATWPEIPNWQGGWLWLEATLNIQFFMEAKE